MVAARLARITRSINSLQRMWDSQESWPVEKRTRGELLSKELTALGPCFVKIGQTLSQRPDVIGEEVRRDVLVPS